MILNLPYTGQYKLRFRYDHISRYARSKRRFLQSTAILEKPDGTSLTASVLAHTTEKNASRHDGRELALTKLLEGRRPLTEKV